MNTPTIIDKGWTGARFLPPPVPAQSAAEPHTLSRGRWANADVHLLHRADGEWVIKDFARRCWPVRWTIGLFLVRRELRALLRCAGIPGVPTDAHRSGRFSFAYRFVVGEQLRRTTPEQCTPEFFQQLEECVHRIHERGVVHLDLRNSRNVIVGADGRPTVIDFQSYLVIGWLPGFLRRFLERIDLSGVYKHWSRFHPASFADDRAELLARANRWRRCWFLRGYLGIGRHPSAKS